MNNSKLPFFPTPFSGETVFSVLSRFAKRLKYNGPTILRKLCGRLFSYESYGGFPSRIDRISEMVPEGNPWEETWNILKNNTGLPYAIYFYDEVRKRNLKEYFSPRNIGLSSMRIPAWPSSPRFCKKCSEEQLKLGFTYFVREHQLPGVTVCFKHHIPLSIGCKFCGRYPIKKASIFLPGDCGCNNFQPLDILIDPHFDIERINWIAEQSAYMVNSEITNATMLDLEEFLTAMGVVKRGRDKFSKLADDIECKFGKDLLMELNYPSHHMGRPAPWLYRVLKKKSKLAITHLLIIGTYCDSVKIFQEMSTIGGDKCVLEKNDNSSGVPKVRVLSAKSIFDDRNFDSTLEIAKLLSTMSNMSFRKAAKRLNMGFYEAARILINTNTRFPLDSKFADGLGIENINSIKSDLRRGIYKKEIQKKYKIHDESILKIILDEPIIQSDYFAAMNKRLIERHRKTLSDVISFFPQATRTEILKKCTQSYFYLKEHDSDWFNNIIPPRSITDNNKSHMSGLKQSRISRVNWNHEDQIFTDKAREVLRQNRELGGKPIWLSKMACLKLIGCQRRYKASRFPNLSIYLQSNIETRDSFRKRRIKWALIEIKNDRNKLGMLKLQLKSCLSQLVLRDYMEYTIAEAQQLRLSFSYSSAFAQYLLGKGTGNTRMSSNN